MKKIKLLPGILMLVLSVAVLGLGIYAAKPREHDVSGTISVQASNVEVEITAYLGTAKNQRISETYSTRSATVIPIYEDVLSFNGADIWTADELETIDLVLEIKNKSTTTDLGAYFLKGEEVPEQVSQGQIAESLSFDGTNGTTTVSNLVTATLPGYRKVDRNNTVDLVCTFNQNQLVSEALDVFFNLPLILEPYNDDISSKSYWSDDGALKILSIGDSLTTDSQEYVYQIAQSAGISQVQLGNLISTTDECTLATHLSNAQNDTAAYTYYQNTAGSWTSTANQKISTALTSTNWDFVIFQQASANSGQADTYNSLSTLLEVVKGVNDEARYAWLMTWAYQSDATHTGFANYSNNQTMMYEAIADAVKTKADSNADIEKIIPVGTAIQNARTSVIGDTLTRDGYHLSNGLGRYIAGLTVVKTLTGKAIGNIEYAPTGTNAVNAEQKQIAISATNEAIASPYVVTNLNVSDSYYVGYDGYYWNGTERTELSAGVTLGENVAESTIGIEGTMSRYFPGQYLNLSTNRVALMANYMPNAKLTQYSGLTVTEIKVVAEKGGNLYIGTGKVADVVNARTNGTTLTVSNASAYAVQAGLNTITLSLAVGEDETVVLGGQGSVGLYYAQGIPAEDEHGNFALVDNQTHTDVVSKNAGFMDTIGIQVSILTSKSTFEQVMNEPFVDSNNISTISDANITKDYTPFIIGNKYLFANKKIGKIGLAVKRVKAINDNQKFTVYLVDISDLKTTNVRKNPYTITLPQSELVGATYDSATQAYTVNKWIYVDVADLNITVGANQTLGFFADGDDVVSGYVQTKQTSNANHSFMINTTKSNMSTSSGYLLQVDVYTINEETYNIQDHIAELREKEAKAGLSNVLGNLNFSILGDSISTFEGHSNSTSVNSTLADNAVYYGGTGNSGSSILSSVEQTWWKQVANQTGMNVLVNNSWSGSRCYDTTAKGGCGTRSQNLHDDTLSDNEGQKEINPNIIAVYLGTNDIHTSGITLGTYNKSQMDSYLQSQATPTNFVEAYAVMINNIINKYGKDGVFCFTLLPFTRVANSKTEQYNTVIKQIADYFDVKVVDLYNNCDVELNSGYFGETTYTHPNEAGMTAIANCFIDVLYETYILNGTN